MLILFSIISFVYALFYIIVMISSFSINYVEDIVSLNIQKIKESGLNLSHEDLDEKNKTYHTELVT